jgi:hypothetical protein
MNKFIAILDLAVIPFSPPMTGHAQKTAVSALHRSHFSIGKLSTREERDRTYVDGEITSNAKKEGGRCGSRSGGLTETAMLSLKTTHTLRPLPRARLSRFTRTRAKSQESSGTTPP